MGLASAHDAGDRVELATVTVDQVVVHKGQRKLYLMHNGRSLKTYDIALGRRPKGAKEFQGDGRTPEGRYVIDGRKVNSSFHRALHISYPNRPDMANAARAGKSAGGSIMIHGLPNGMIADRVGHPEYDWTNGCIAVTNREIDEIWRLVRDGTEIVIQP